MLQIIDRVSVVVALKNPVLLSERASRAEAKMPFEASGQLSRLMTVAPQEADRLPVAQSSPFPIIVDLDHTFFKTDSLYELLVSGLFSRPGGTLLALFALKSGIAAFKRRLSDVATLDVEVLPVREELLTYLKQEAVNGREIYLATTGRQNDASRVVERFPIFKTVQVKDQYADLEGHNKAQWLKDVFPNGFVYAGDSRADLPVWQRAKAAIIASASPSLESAVQFAGVPIQQTFDKKPRQPGAWLSAVRPHQWVKNLVVLVPVLLGWRHVTAASFAVTVAMALLLCIVGSLTYLVNDMADLSSDRRHWSKQRRPFASGTIAVREGLLVVGIALPAFCILGLWISPLAGIGLLSYVVVTLGYSFGWRRIPLFDTFIIALLFTIRILIGIAAAKLVPSAWLLTFAMFFFFSLALAKRHTEILRSAEHGLGTLEGRGYQPGDESLTLTFGISASMASIVIVVIYLVEEIFARQIYRTPAWLWVAPIAIFLFSCRIWVLSHRGRMTDDPVAFALRDRVSLGLGVLVAISILLAL